MSFIKGKLHGDAVNEFDNSLGTVKEFNEIFPYCKIDNVNKDYLVEIGQLINDGEIVKREITVNGVKKIHDFYRFPQLWKKYQVGEQFFSNIRDIERQYQVGIKRVYKALETGTLKNLPIKKLY